MSACDHLLRYVLFDLWTASQKILEYIQQNQSRIRDYTNLKYGPGFWPVHQIQATLMAQALNATLITKGHACFQNGGFGGSKWREGIYPRILPDARTFERKDKTPIFAWEKYYNKSGHYFSATSELLGFALKPKLEYTFVYCAFPKRDWDSSWNVSFFVAPFDYLSWLGIFCSLVLISLLTLSSLHRRRFSFQLLSTFSVLLSVGSVSSYVIKYRSKLFVLWMLAALVLTNGYTGDMTSFVIKPPPEKILKTFEDLQKNNFSFIFDKKYIFDITTTLVKILTGKSFIQKNVLAMKMLLEKAVLQEDR